MINRKFLKYLCLIIILSSQAILCHAFLPDVSLAVTPIARWDVVPYQRISSGQVFKIGVAAFSKAGIKRVEFTVTGQGYSGSNPLQAGTMSYNDQTDVYEYWVPIDGSDFATNGKFTVQAVVLGMDGVNRTLESLPLVVNATGALPQPKAWVSKTGSDTAGSINNSAKPFLTVGKAVSSIQAVNGGSSDGGIIYLFNGTYSLGDGSVSTTNEWLTITRDSSATKDGVVINGSGTIRNTSLLKIDGVTVQSLGSGQYVFVKGTPVNLWVNDSRIIGSGRAVINSNPIHFSSDVGHYSTNNYTYNADYAYRRATLVRGANMNVIGNDGLANTLVAINCTLDDLDNGPNPAWHADAYQVFTGVDAPPADNRIIYNFKATNLHYEGVFMRSDAGLATNNAFVNLFIEVREPASKNETNSYAFMSVAVNQSWDHLLIWNSTFVNGHGEFPGTYTNSSFIGNVVYQYVDARTAIGDSTLPYALPGNTGGNVFLYNHYLHVYGETPACTPNSRFVDSGWPCPHWRAKKPDSGTSPTATVGDGVIDLDNPASATFGFPVAGSVLIDRIPFATVPADLYGNARVGNPEVGAIELSSSTNPPPPPSLSTPAGFQLNL